MAILRDETVGGMRSTFSRLLNIWKRVNMLMSTLFAPTRLYTCQPNWLHTYLLKGGS
jgi:hypothetical protein